MTSLVSGPVRDRRPTNPFGWQYVILLGMTKALKEVLAEVERLPEADQENISRQVLNHVEKLRALRADIDAGIRSLDDGQGQELDMDDVISVARNQHAQGR